MKKQFSAVKQTEKIVHVLRNAIQSKGRFSTMDIAEWTGLSRFSANVISRQLVKEGYLISDGCKPLGFKATDKAKQLFWVAV
ncbi:MAG: hypothetical protein ACN6OV_05900 [Acinetobacter sp.]|uniref:hypothetical protein n=1 Tax=Acinetobacter sp. TaxID=472 RepID=UPI003D00C1A4